MHRGIELQFAGERHRIALSDLAGGAGIIVYGQTEVVKDLIAAATRRRRSAPLRGRGRRAPRHRDRPAGITFTHDGRRQELECDLVAGCDGFHGVCRPSIPGGALRESSREYPFGWLGVLADVAPSNDELVYAHSGRGFALLAYARRP